MFNRSCSVISIDAGEKKMSHRPLRRNWMNRELVLMKLIKLFAEAIADSKVFHAQLASNVI